MQKIQYDILMMVGDMRWFSKSVSGDEFEIVHHIISHLLDISKSENFKFAISLCLLGATVLSQTPKLSQTQYLSLRLMVSPINCACLNSLTIVLCFSDSVEVQFRCGWERELFILVFLLKYNFFRLSGRLLFESFQNLAFKGI